MPECMHHLPERLKTEIALDRAGIGGGAIRAEFDGTTSPDIDVFVFTHELYVELSSLFGGVSIPGTDDLVSRVTHAGRVIELVYWDGIHSPEAYLEHVDFDISSGMYSGGEYYSVPSFQEATRTKVMKYLPGADRIPEISYRRYRKYSLRYGYRMDASIHALLQAWRNG